MIKNDVLFYTLGTTAEFFLFICSTRVATQFFGRIPISIDTTVRLILFVNSYIIFKIQGNHHHIAVLIPR